MIKPNRCEVHKDTDNDTYHVYRVYRFLGKEFGFWVEGTYWDNGMGCFCTMPKIFPTLEDAENHIASIYNNTPFKPKYVKEAEYTTSTTKPHPERDHYDYY